MTFRPTGSWVAIPTPMHEDGSIDYKGFRRLIDFQAENGTSALLIGGSAGEVAMLSLEERREIARQLAPYTRDKIPTFFSCGTTTTQDSLALTKYTEDQGAFGGLLTVPAYCLPPQEAVLEYMVSVMTSVSMPMAFYNNPQRVHVRVTPETIAAMHKAAPNFIADKEAVPDPEQVVRVVELTGGSISVLTCDNPAYALLPTAVTVADGLANLTGNIDPQGMADIAVPLWKSAEVRTWRERFIALLPLMRASYWLTNPIIIKYALSLMGLPAGPLRRPLLPVHKDMQQRVEEIVDRYNLKSRYAAWAQGQMVSV